MLSWEWILISCFMIYAVRPILLVERRNEFMRENLSHRSYSCLVWAPFFGPKLFLFKNLKEIQFQNIQWGKLISLGKSENLSCFFQAVFSGSNKTFVARNSEFHKRFFQEACYRGELDDKDYNRNLCVSWKACSTKIDGKIDGEIGFSDANIF